MLRCTVNKTSKKKKNLQPEQQRKYICRSKWTNSVTVSLNEQIEKEAVSVIRQLSRTQFCLTAPTVNYTVGPHLARSNLSSPDGPVLSRHFVPYKPGSVLGQTQLMG